MTKIQLTIFITVLFSIAGWVGATSFIFSNQSWLLENQGNSVWVCSLHSMTVQTVLLSSVFGLFIAIPLAYVHHWQSKKTGLLRWLIPTVVHLFLAPCTVFVINYAYLIFWPSEKEFELNKIVLLLMSEGWKEFFGAYFLIIMCPLLLIGSRSPKSKIDP